MDRLSKDEREFLRKLLVLHDTDSFKSFDQISESETVYYANKFADGFECLAEKLQEKEGVDLHYNKKQLALAFIRWIHSMFVFRIQPDETENPNSYRSFGRLAYWMLKHKCIVSPNVDSSLDELNSKFTFMVIVGCISKNEDKKLIISREFVNRIVHELTYHPQMSETNFGVLFESMFTVHSISVE